MNVTLACPKCRTEQTRVLDPLPEHLECSACHYAIPWDASAVSPDAVRRCGVCGSEELFIRKDFSQRLGLTIIIAGFVVSSLFWAMHRSWLSYAVLFATALLDAGLYMITGNSLRCYRCQAEYRGMRNLEQHNPFDLETHERHRQIAARQREARRREAKPAATDPSSDVGQANAGSVESTAP